MRIVFMGTPEFAVPSLEMLAATHEVVGVYTKADSASGRGARLLPSAVKRAAGELNLAVHEVKTLRDSAVVEVLRGLEPEIVVVAAYGLILPPDVLSIPPRGCVNVHGSLLPRWRGAAPIQRAILEGDRETGVTIMLMEEGLDTGPYCLVDRTPIAEKTATQLVGELAEMGARALQAALARIERSECEWIEQEDLLATYAEKITKRDVLLSPELSVEDALRRIRASGPQAPSRAAIARKGFTVAEAVASDIRVERGSAVLDAGSLLLGFKDGAVAVNRVKPDGKQEMSGSDWARGLRLTGLETWEGPS